MSTSTKTKAPCNSCSGHTFHDILFEKKASGSDEIAEDFSIEWGTEWRVIQCRGCGLISMKRESWNSESLGHDGNPATETVFFPPRTFREFPAWLRNDFFSETCPPEVEQLMKELYVALQNNCRGAATMLTRAIFEHTMIDQTGDQGTFAKNLGKFEAQGFIGKKHAEVVASMLEAGHASMHRAFIPKQADIVTLVDILEGVLRVVYVDAPKAAELKARIPVKKKSQLSPASAVASGLPPSSPAKPPV